MGLNDIELPAFLIAGLYKETLVEGEQKGPDLKIPQKEVPADIQYLGNNQKNICLLVNYANDIYLPAEQLNFLVSILQACKLNLGDVAIVNYHRHKIAFKDVKQQLHCSFLFIFGVDAVALGLKKLSPFSVTDIEDCQVVLSPEPEQLNNSSLESKLMKSKLWLCLKHLFKV